MIKYSLFTFCLSFLSFSCTGETKQGDLLEIPVDIDQNVSLPLSEITEELTVIELELTDESPINPDRIKRILLFKNYVIVTEHEKILVFNKDGKFIRTIGSKGQGPGEFIVIRNLTLDEKTGVYF